MPPPTITTRACGGSGSRGCKGCAATDPLGGCSGDSRRRTTSSGRPAKAASEVGERGGRARNGTCAAGGSPARSAQSRIAAARQLFP